MRHTRAKSLKSRSKGPMVSEPKSPVCLVLATAIAAALSPAYGQQAESTAALEEITVTATKRSENLQNVPISITALSNETLGQLNVSDFNDYTKLLSSVATQSYGPGFGRVYMRGVASGDYPNHSGPLPSVGTYLDEQPITTIQGALNLHVYDVQRVEALAGPQGTLYGASSEAGTIRIITNQPDPTGYSAAYNVKVGTYSHGTISDTVEGYVNIPLSDASAIRLVAWNEHDAGYISNVPGTLTYPFSGGTLNNSAIATRDYNPVSTFGARAALKVDLNDRWSIAPVLMAQSANANGTFAYEADQAPYTVSHFYPEGSTDHWVDVALTVRGKIANLDLTYAGAFLKRNDNTRVDYTGYTLAYDNYANYWHDKNGATLANPSQVIHNRDNYSMQSHEVRLSSPVDSLVRFTAGLFYQRQQHGIEQDYQIPGLDPAIQIPGWPDTWWLTEQVRVNRDYAAFGEVAYDLAPRLTLTSGLREYRYDSAIKGFTGVNDPAFISLGTPSCSVPFTPFNGAPCVDINKSVSGHGVTPKVNLTYKFAADKLVYATWSRGYRPGGINRFANLAPYQADYLTNYEVGWKTSWAENRIRLNGALFDEEWKNFQFAFLGPNSATEVVNAGAARIKGVETELDVVPIDGLTVSAKLTLLDARLTKAYCGGVDLLSSQPVSSDPCPVDSASAVPYAALAPAGQQLPITPRFKGDMTARYSWSMGGVKPYVQGAWVYQSMVWADLRTYERNLIGPQPAYGLVDFAAGVETHSWVAELYVKNAFNRLAELYRYAECTPGKLNSSTGTNGPVCVVPGVAGLSSYVGVEPPRFVGLKFGQKF
jgi:iron complex outermembrane receptor protein